MGVGVEKSSQGVPAARLIAECIGSTITEK